MKLYFCDADLSVIMPTEKTIKNKKYVITCSKSTIHSSYFILLAMQNLAA